MRFHFDNARCFQRRKLRVETVPIMDQLSEIGKNIFTVIKMEYICTALHIQQLS